MRGDEAWLGTPGEDLTNLAAVAHAGRDTIAAQHRERPDRRRDPLIEEHRGQVDPRRWRAIPH